mgnify:CR=1 FL=1|jgi:hypothetical protein
MNLLTELVKAGLVFDGVTVEQLDDNLWNLQFPLGTIPAGTYDGGYWGDATISETDATLELTVGDLYDEDEFVVGEGTVVLNYANGSGLAYTGDLEEVVTARIKDLYGFKATGSEQGMQGEDYLSLDIFQDAA